MKQVFNLAYFGSPLILIALIASNNTTKYSNLAYLIPMLFGVFSYTWLLWQFVLSARPKFIEKSIGLDKMYRFHGTMAIVSILLILVHKTLIEMLFSESIFTSLGSASLVIFGGITAISLILMAPGKLKKIPLINEILDVIHSFKIITYERLKSVHNLTFVALMLMQVHVLFTSSARSNVLIFNTYMAYFFVAVGFYLYHKVIKSWFLDGRRYLVSQIIAESDDTLSIELQPKNGRIFKYRPGQFGFFTIYSGDIPSEEHPFSISSSPTDRSHIAITVKALGDFTKQLKNLSVGSEVTIDGPFGRFSHLAFKKEKATVFVAGGVGITPVLSMMQYMKAMDENRKVLLLWSVKKQTDLIRIGELKSFEAQMPNFKCIPIVSSDTSWQGESGRLDPTRLQTILAANGFFTEKTGYFVCGPQNLMEMTLKSLKQFGISKKQIHYEKFTV